MPQEEAAQELEELILEINDSDEPQKEQLLKLKEFRGVDIAELFHTVKRSFRTPLFASFSEELASEILVELDDILAIEILRDLPPERIASLLNYLPPDEGADMIALSEEEDQPEILTHVKDDLATQIRDLATYAPESAGGLMTSNFVCVGGEENIRSTIFKVKTSEHAETINYIYVVDEKGRLEGVVSLRELIQANLSDAASSIMERDLISVPLEMDQEEVSRIANKYHLHTLPVVDGDGIMKGIVTFDDLMEVLEEESSEDMYKMAGEVTDHPTHQPVLRRLMARLPWLLMTLAGTALAAGMIKVFEHMFSVEGSVPVASFQDFKALVTAAFSDVDEDNIIAFLLCFVPMIGGMAGSVGLQSATVMVRGFATGEVVPAYFMRILSKEIIIAAIIGLVSGLIISGLILIIFQQGFLGIVIGLSLFSAVVCAALLGTFAPFLCLMIKVDPAYASGPLLTTMNDIFGFLIFFGIAYTLVG